MPVAFAADTPCLFSRKRLEQREGDIDRLVILRFGTRNISRQRANCTTRWRQQKFFALQMPRGIMAGQPTHRHGFDVRSEEHTSELQSHSDLVCRLLLEKKKKSTIVASQL